MSLEKLREKIRIKKKEESELIHSHRYKNNVFYRNWFDVDFQLREWLNNSKTPKKQKDIISSLLSKVIVLYSATHDSPIQKLNEDVSDMMFQLSFQKDADIQLLREDVARLRDENREMKIKLDVQDKTIISLQKEVEFYEEEE